MLVPNESTPGWTMKKVYEAISRVSADLSEVGVEKSQTNSFHKYKFRGIDDVMNAVSPLLPKHRLLILPSVKSHKHELMTDAKGAKQLHILAECVFTFVSLDDDSTHEVIYWGESLDGGDKGTNKAMAFAYKYCVSQVFCIPYEGMDDGDKTSPQVGTKVEHTTKQEPAKQEQAKPAANKPAPPAAGSPEEMANLRAACKVQAEKLLLGPQFAEPGMVLDPWEEMTSDESNLMKFVKPLPARLRDPAKNYFKFLWWQMRIVAAGPGRAQMDLRREIDADNTMADKAKIMLKTESEKAEEVML